MEVELLRYILDMYEGVKNTKLYMNTHKIHTKQNWIKLMSVEMAQSV